jgi:hypothetical protein
VPKSQLKQWYALNHLNCKPIIRSDHNNCMFQGRVHNPSGEGVRAISSEVKNRAAKLSNGNNSSSSSPDESLPNSGQERNRHPHHPHVEHETKDTEVGSSKRNITRKKGEGSAQLHNNKGKKQGGAG